MKWREFYLKYKSRQKGFNTQILIVKFSSAYILRGAGVTKSISQSVKMYNKRSTGWYFLFGYYDIIQGVSKELDSYQLYFLILYNILYTYLVVFIKYWQPNEFWLETVVDRFLLSHFNFSSHVQ